MKIKVFVILLFVLKIVHGQEELPDNYLPINFKLIKGELIGESEYLEGFVFNMQLPIDTISIISSKEELYNLVKHHKITGTLIYPNDKITDIEYELVCHRGITGIYMKTTLGYFLWEMVEFNKDSIFVAINWWYCPPATSTDLAILKMTDSLLTNAINWHQEDDRKCVIDIESNIWSLFCALKYASIEKAKEYNHHNTAIQTVRFVIDDLKPNHNYDHTLMDFNNSSHTTHSDIKHVIREAKIRIEKELKD